MARVAAEPHDPETDAEWGARDALLALLFLAAAAIPRVLGISELGFHSDEGIFLAIAANPTPSDVWRNNLVGPHPPANVLLLHAMTAISWDPLWLKSVHLVAGVLCAGLAYAFGRQLLNRWAGSAFATLVAFSPALIELSRVVRNYAPGFALLLVAGIALARWHHTRDGRWLYGFAIAQLLAATWHFTFVTVFLGMNVAIAVALLEWRAPLREWLRAGAVQLPLAAFYGFAVFTQVAPHREDLAATSRELYRVDYELATSGDVLPAAIAPFREVLAHLANPELAPWLLASAIAGAVALAIARRWFALALLVAPLPFAFALQALGIAPIGGTRHSAYLFVSLFGLVSACAWAVPTASKRLDATVLGVVPEAIACGLAAYYVASTMQLMEGRVETKRGLVSGVRNITAIEAPTRRVDVAQTADLLAKLPDDGEIALLSYNAMLVLRPHLAPGPMRYAPEEPVHFHHRGRDYYYVPDELPSLSPTRLRAALSAFDAHFGFQPAGRVWVPHAGWELYAPSLTETFRVVYRGDKANQRHGQHRNDQGQPIVSVIDLAALAGLPTVTAEEERRRIGRYVHMRTTAGLDGELAPLD